MTTWNFRIRLNRVPDDVEVDALYDAGLSDAAVEGDLLDIDREAESLADAVVSAVAHVSAVKGLHAVGLDLGDEVTLADAAQRLGGGRTAESLRLLAEGKRGPGGFPSPIVDTGKIRVYSWADIAGGAVFEWSVRGLTSGVGRVRCCRSGWWRPPAW